MNLTDEFPNIEIMHTGFPLEDGKKYLLKETEISLVIPVCREHTHILTPLLCSSPRFFDIISRGRILVQSQNKSVFVK